MTRVIDRDCHDVHDFHDRYRNVILVIFRDVQKISTFISI